VLFLREVYLIALNSFREAVRDKIPYVVLLTAIGLAAFSVLLGEWSVFDREFVVKSTTITIVSLSGFFIALFAGVGQVQREIQKKTIHTILSKPVSRSAFLLGKYIGLLALLLMHVSLLSLTLIFVLWATSSAITAPVIQACYLVFWELAIVLAFAILFSTYSSALISSIFSFGMYLIGNLGNQILKEIHLVYRMSEDGSFLQQHGQLIYNLAKLINYIIPNLFKFNASMQAAHNIALEPSYIIWMSIYALGYSAVVLCLAVALFKNKDFV